MVLGLSSTTRIRGRRRRAEGSLVPGLLRKEIVDNFLGTSITGQLLNRIVTKIVSNTTWISCGTAPRVYTSFRYLWFKTRSSDEGFFLNSFSPDVGPR